MRARWIGAFLGCCLPASAPAAAGAMELTGSGVFNPYGSVTGANVEFPGNAHSGFEVQIAYVGYHYKDGGYSEDGSGGIAGARGRWYPTPEGAEHRSFWIAGGLSFANIGWESYDYNNGSPKSDKGTVSGVAPTLGLGWKFVLNENRFVIDPQLLFAYLSGASNPLLVGAGVSLGWRFP